MERQKTNVTGKEAEIYRTILKGILDYEFEIQDDK